MNRDLVVAAFSFALFVSPASAQGLGTWLGDRMGLGDVGRALDGAHDGLKQAVPPWRHVEEGTSGFVRHGLQELSGETAGPALAQMIEVSRNNTINAGVQPIPANIRAALTGFFDQDILNKVHFRVGLGNDLLLASNAFRYGDAVAITLNEVIMFKNADRAHGDLALWAHELAHVEQYQRWGVLDFAKRYVKDWDAVEQEATDRANRFVAWRNQTPVFSQMPSTQGHATATANICNTPYGRCGMMSPVPFGSPCGCQSQWGLLYGTASN